MGKKRDEREVLKQIPFQCLESQTNTHHLLWQMLSSYSTMIDTGIRAGLLYVLTVNF